MPGKTETTKREVIPDKLELVKSYIEEYISMRPEHDRTEYGKAYIAGLEKSLEIIKSLTPNTWKIHT